MTDDKDYKFLLEKIKRNRGIDFSEYRQSILMRRIKHRFHLTGCANYWDYIILLNKEPEEYDRLIETLTIKVSKFFRDSQTFDLLRMLVIPEIISQKESQGNNTIRAWSCGTAWGQEAYSIAMLFSENLGSMLDEYDVQIIGTDIDRNVLEQAPWGSYSKSALGNIKPHQLFKYFTKFDDRYVVNDRVRSLVTFRYHDVIQDNPMSEVDLVLCRNLLIYFEKELQEKVMQNIYSSMKQAGFLVLGMTETLPLFSIGYFKALDINARVYVKK